MNTSQLPCRHIHHSCRGIRFPSKHCLRQFIDLDSEKGCSYLEKRQLNEKPEKINLSMFDLEELCSLRAAWTRPSRVQMQNRTQHVAQSRLLLTVELEMIQS